MSGATGTSKKKSSFQNKFKEMPKYEPITVEPRPQTKAYDWMTHGNSIGNGSLIYINEIDPHNLEAIRARQLALAKGRHARQELYFAKRREEKRKQ